GNRECFFFGDGYGSLWHNPWRAVFPSFRKDEGRFSEGSLMRIPKAPRFRRGRKVRQSGGSQPWLSPAKASLHGDENENPRRGGITGWSRSFRCLGRIPISRRP